MRLYSRMLVRHWAARYRPRALIRGAALQAGPEESRSRMVVNSQVAAVNTAAPPRVAFHISFAGV